MSLYWVDGASVDASAWPPRLPSMWIGDGLMETLRVDTRGALWPARHITRLTGAAQALTLCDDIPALTGQVEAAIAWATGECKSLSSLRIFVWSAGVVPAVCATVSSYVAPTTAAYQAGISVACTALRHPGAIGGGKSASRGWAQASKRWAASAGYDAPLFVDAAGRVIESADANVIWRSGGGWFTPPASSGALPGTTLQTLRERGLTITPEATTAAQLERADAVVLLSSLRLAMGVKSIGSRTFETPDADASYLRHILLTDV